MKREHTLHFLKPFAGILPLQSMISVSSQRLFVPLWHAVSDHPAEHYSSLFSVPSIDSFRKTLDSLLRFYSPVSLQEFNEIRCEKKISKKPVMHLTFDDGLRECYEVIAPILLEKGIPATFFINPYFVDNRQLFYRYKCSILVNRLQKKNVPECVHSALSYLLMSNEIVAPSAIEGLMNVSFASGDLLERAAEILKVDFAGYLVSVKPYMSQDEMEQLIKKGFTLGAHSLDHPFFPEIDQEQQVEQAFRSMELVEKQFGLNYAAFAFPFSDDQVQASFWEKLKMLHPAPFMTFGTAGPKKDSIADNFQRTGMELPGLDGMEIVKTEYLYYLLKSLIGKNRIKRS